ncbi:hypothetical protein GDO78_016778 [Eleutherodactylus coqui]|uniref:UPAR/Ly6 domain-containing protein n=1 Tax=Eleutherodactylus coqui TaxID=57060 RepID=A0A8J6EKR3_ELECQ|nr:hypothetical protein GDO78_016778 [Eleutherodactylus coqui]
MGQGQVINRECNNCALRFLSTCFGSTSQYAQCQESAFCGVTNYILGNTIVFARYGCIESANCNLTSQSGTGALRAITANTTCCNTNFCNGGFTARAPHLAVLGSLSIFLLYITS